MDKIGKALKKLSAKERANIKEILLLISAGKFETLHTKKLRGRQDIFRARKGRLRVIYRVGRGGDISVLAVERRSENTYRKW